MRCTCNRRNQWENGPCDACAYEDICATCTEYQSNCRCEGDDE